MSYSCTYLAPGEAIVDSTTVHDDNAVVDYDIHTLSREGLVTGDEVLLVIRGLSERLVLAEGNPLNLTWVNGAGYVQMVELETGKVSAPVMSEHRIRELEIQPGTLYRYANPYHSRPLVVRDHCAGFKLEYEPSLETVANGLISAYTSIKR